MRYSIAYMIFAVCAPAGTLSSVVTLPKQTQPANVMVRDLAGNVYVGSGAVFGIDGSPGGPGAVVTKLSSNGNVDFSTTLAPDNPQSAVTGLAFAPDGSILAVGLVQGSFGLTRDAAETQPVGTPTGFFAHLDVEGRVIYASYLNATAGGAQNEFGSPLAIAADSQGAAYITGSGLFDPTPGALGANATTQPLGYFVVKLDRTGKQVWATGAIGGSAIAIDAQGFVYIAGSQAWAFPLPVTAGAFQTAVTLNTCSGNKAFGVPCLNQYAAKLDPSATKLIYCTWLTGAHGASPSGLLIDSEGNAILAGTTQSSDYPVTPLAFQATDYATSPPPAVTAGEPCCFSAAPPYTGYVTKLNAAGTGLVFSTYVGGSAQDTIDAAALDTKGNIYLVGHASSSDFPGTPALPDACKPSVAYQTPYLARLSADGRSLTATQIAYGLVYAQGFLSTPGGAPPQNAVAGFDSQGHATIAFNGSLASLDLFGASQNFACATDAADHIPLAQIAPGQLLSLFGKGIGETAAMTVQPRNGIFPVSLGDGSTVKIHGIPAPILYSSDSQINVQVPYEIDGQTSVKLEIHDPARDVAGTRQYGVVSSQPSAFLSLSYDPCSSSGSLPEGFPATARNTDGSLNNCANPAAPGSDVTIFVNGLGLAKPGLVSGAIAPAPGAPLDLPVTVSGYAQFVSATSDPGSINGVWAVTVKVMPPASGAHSVQSIPFTLTLNGLTLRDPLAVWVK